MVLSPYPVPETRSRAILSRSWYLFGVPCDGWWYRVSVNERRYWGVYLGLGETQGGPPGWWSFPSPGDFLKRAGRLDCWHEWGVGASRFQIRETRIGYNILIISYLCSVLRIIYVMQNRIKEYSVKRLA